MSNDAIYAETNEKKGTVADVASSLGSPDVEHGSFEHTSKIGTWLRKLGVEETGIQPIPVDQRTNQRPSDLCNIFVSANACTATLALGYLGPVLLGMGWWDSFYSVIIFNLIGAVAPALFAMFGPKLGLRTMIIPRYSFGWWPAKVLAFLNVINQIGWAIVNCLSGALILYDVGDGALPLAVAVLLIGLVAFIIGFFGYNVIHTYERYSWMVMTVCFIILAGFGGSHFVNTPMLKGSEGSYAVLSFSTIIIGFQVAWAPIAADYGVYMRDTTPARKPFAWSYLGLVLSQILVELLGVAVGTLINSPNPIFPAAYKKAAIGGLIGACFEGHGKGVRGFGKFIEVLLSFSTAAVVITNLYSLGLSVQMITTKLIRVPRIIWVSIGSAAFLAAAIAGRNHLNTVLSNFLDICAYWLVPFCTIVLLEHFIWHRNWDYDVENWNNKHVMPYGIAASFSWIVGTVLALLSMSQDWWVGPIAIAVGGKPFGADISWYLALGATTILFIPLRYWERKTFGR